MRRADRGHHVGVRQVAGSVLQGAGCAAARRLIGRLSAGGQRRGYR